MAEEPAFGEAGTLVLDQRFAIVPEWIIDAEISDCAFRLYAVLLRYGQTSGQRMPGRALLAQRLHKGSKDTVDRALKELAAIGAVTVEHRRSGTRNLTNRYHLHTDTPGAPASSSSPTDRSAVAASRSGCPPVPGRTDAPTRCAAGSRDSASAELDEASAGGPGRTAAATPGRTGAATGGRTDRVSVAAPVRPDPEGSTEKEPPPTPPGTPARPATSVDPAAVVAVRLADAGQQDLDQLAARCQQLRRALGEPGTRWTTGRLVQPLHEVLIVQGRLPAAAVRALLLVAADPATKSPMRLPCPGPWWDSPAPSRPGLTPAEAVELERLEVRLREADGRRVWLQQRARAELTERGDDLTRLAVARLACQLLDEAELTPC